VRLFIKGNKFLDFHIGIAFQSYLIKFFESELRVSPAEERLATWKEKSRLLMQSLYDWIQEQMKTLSRHSDTAKVFTYLLKQWDALNEYYRNGWVEIDNNLCKKALLQKSAGDKLIFNFC